MRYKPGYKQEKRKELLYISGQLAKQQGFDATGVDGFMKAAGVTSGAFYSHFASKHALLKALLESELQQSFSRWENNPHNNPHEWLDFELNRYLNISHVQHADHGCILPALASEVARSDIDIKQLYQQELLRGHALFTQHLGSEDKAWAVLCQLVGAISLARGMADENIQKQVIESSKAFLKASLNV